MSILRGLFEYRVRDSFRSLRSLHQSSPARRAPLVNPARPTPVLQNIKGPGVNVILRGLFEYRVRDLNPCYRRERAAS